MVAEATDALLALLWAALNTPLLPTEAAAEDAEAAAEDAEAAEVLAATETEADAEASDAEDSAKA